MFSNQQPETSKVAADLISQDLTHTALNALGITGNNFVMFPTDTYLNLYLRFSVRTALIEFFFAGRNRQSPVQRFAC